MHFVVNLKRPNNPNPKKSNDDKSYWKPQNGYMQVKLKLKKVIL